MLATFGGCQLHVTAFLVNYPIAELGEQRRQLDAGKASRRFHVAMT